MKRIIGLFLTLVIVVTGCTGEVASTQTPINNDPFVEPTGELATKTWISPGVVEIGNFYGGAEADWLIRVHNGGTAPATFSVIYRFPDNTREGFSAPPATARLWVTISDPNPVILAGQTKEILINVKLPTGVNVPDKWEFWTAVSEQTGGMIATEMCTRWLITMR